MPRQYTPRVSCICHECGKEFYLPPFKIAAGSGKYCSRTCTIAFRRHTPAFRSEATKQKIAEVKRGSPGLFGKANPMYRHGHTATTEKYCPICGANFVAKAGRTACSSECSEAVRLASLANFYATAAGAAAKAESSNRLAGKGNPRWRDGRALTTYAPGWTYRLKRRIRQRDGGVCRRCGAHPSNGRAHPVHHIDGEKIDHSPQNLVTLCPACHTWVHVHAIDASIYLP